MTLSSQIELITIDLDDTLWPCMPTIMRAENISYDWLKQHLPKIPQQYSIEQLRDKRQQLMSQNTQLQHDLSAARVAHFHQLADEFSYDYDWVEQGFKVFYDARQRVTMFDEAIDVLQQLSTRYKLVALTNGNADISRVGLAQYFDDQISAADVSAAKPHPAMFIEAMRKMQVNPLQTLHIGDHAVHDIQGARNAGVRSVWVNRSAESWAEQGFNADFEVSDLNGLLDLLI